MAQISTHDQQESHALQWLGRVLVDDEDWERACRAAARWRATPSALVALATEHRVTPILATNLAGLHARWPQHVPETVVAVARGVADDLLEQRRVSLNELHRVLAAARELGLDIMMVKGLSIGRLYPPRYTRWFRDCDLFLRNLDDALALYEWLFDHGYQFFKYELPFFRANRGKLYGQYAVERPIKGRSVCLDVHWGHFEFGYNGFVAADLWTSAETIADGDSLLRVPDPARSLLLTAAHAVGQGHFRRNDVNDTIAVLLHKKVDWVELAAQANENDLAPVLTGLVRHAARSPGLRDASSPALEALGRQRGSAVWRFRRRQGILERSLINAWWSMRVERRRGRRVRALAVAFECLFYFMYVLWILGTRSVEVAHRTRTRWERAALKLMARATPIRGLIPDRSFVRLAPIGAHVLAQLPEPVLPHRVYEPGLLLYAEDGGVGVFLSRRHIFIPMYDFVVEPAEEVRGLELAARALGATRLTDGRNP